VHIRQSRLDRIVRQQEKQEHCVICGWVQYQHGLSGKNERKRKAEKRKTFEVSDYVYQFHLRTFLDER